MGKIIKQKSITSLFANNKIIPVIIIEDEKKVRKLADIFIEHEIYTMEITLRTANALKAIEIVASEFPQIQVGAGTITKITDMQDCINAGAKYLVSPTGQNDIVNSAIDNNYPLLPAASTVTESHNLFIKGYKFQKFFPAILAGGTSMLETIASVLPEINFCPTGGINNNNINQFLHLANVQTVGSSSLCSREELLQEQWQDIAKKCQNMKLITKGTQIHD